MTTPADPWGDQFNQEERALLAPFVTDLDVPIFGLCNLPEVVKGALFSRYSRTDKSLRRILLDEFIQAPESGFAAIVGSARENGADQLVAVRQAEAFYERVIENVREKVGEQVRERLATTIKQTLEDGLRARLGGAMRSACAEQAVLGLGVDHEGFAEALKYRLIDGLREEVTVVVSEKVCVALRERFDEAVKDAMLRGLTPMRGETPFGQ